MENKNQNKKRIIRTKEKKGVKAAVSLNITKKKTGYLCKKKKIKLIRNKSNYIKSSILYNLVKRSIAFFYKNKLKNKRQFFKKDRHPYGKSYFWIKLWEKLFELPRAIVGIIKIATHFCIKLTYFSFVFGVVAVIIFRAAPGILSAPQSVVVTTKAEWEQGSLDNVATFNVTAANDAIQLKPAGDWATRVWAPPEDVIGGGHASAMADDYLYVMRGYSDKAFWRFDTINSTWEVLPDLPMPAYYGADMTYDNYGNIYLIFGGFSKKFYKYNIDAEVFTELPELLDTPWIGASITTDGTDIFIVRGNTTTDFWKYDVSEETWGNLSATPGNVSTGGDLVNGQDGYFYLVRGGNTRYFDRYNLTTRAWDQTPTDLPASGCSGGACNMNGEQNGVYHGGYLYFLQSAGRTDFLRYKISSPGENVWEILTSDAASATVNYSSLTVNANDNLLYAFRGNGTYDFWKFDPTEAAGQRWVGPRQVNDGVNGTISTGGDLIWNGESGAGNYVYAIRGGNTANLYRYNVSTNTWTAMSNVSYGNVNNDIKGTWYNGSLYFPRYNSTSVYTFDGTAWSTISDLLPAVVYNGSAMAYNSGDSRIYILRGGATPTMYYRPTAGGAWTTAANMSVNDGGVVVNYYANVGGRMISDETNLYIMPGDGETAFLRYNTGTNDYTKMAPTPFSQWYGTDMTYNGNGKIVALAGYYKNETWEYDIANDAWRRLPDNQKYTYGRGPFQGASVEFSGGNSYYATTGQGLADMWSFTDDTVDYKTSGTYISQAIDLAQVSSWLSFEKTEDKPINTDITYETRTSADNADWSTWQAISGSTIQSPVNRYVQIKATLTSVDGINTPTVFDYTVSYNSEDVTPDNPSSMTVTSQQVGGTELTSGTAYPYDHPYFNWPEAEVAGGATDDGAGVAGYYVYFGTNNTADPVSDGTYVTSTFYLVNETLTAGTYYFRLKTKDSNGNIADSAWEAFTYVYDGVSPPENSIKTAESDFSAGTLTDISASSIPDSLRLQSKSGFWNQERLSLTPNSIYIGGELTLSSCHGSSNHCLYTFRGYNTNTFFRYEIETDTWSTSPAAFANAPATVYPGGSLVAGPNGYLYALRGNNTSDFWQYDIENNLWTVMDGVPKIVTYGATLTYDNERYLYATVGNDDVFYRYDTCNNVSPCTPGWTQKTNADFGNPNTADGQRTYVGSDAIYDGEGNVYMNQGNYYPYFSRYSVAENDWTILPQMPAGAYNGGSLVYDEENNDIYALSGKSRLSMFKYDIDTETWTTAPDAPGTISYGADMAKHGDYIYVTRGGATTGFYRFDVAHNTWQLPTFGLFGPHYLGGSYFNYSYGTFMASNGSNGLYMIRGYYDNTFGLYNVENGSFTDLARLPVGAYRGATLLYNEDENTVYYNPGSIYTVRTGMNNYFFKYDVTTNVWSEITTDRPPLQTNYGADMVYDGTRYIYLTRGINTNTWWRYDTQAAAGSRWSTMSTTGGAYWSDGGNIIYKDGYIYATRGGGYATSWRFDVAGGTWSVMGNLPATVNGGGSLVDGGDGYLYAACGNNTSNYYRYDTTQSLPGSWEAVSDSIPAQVYTGGVGENVSNRNWQIAGGGTNTFADGLYSYVIGSESAGIGFEESGVYESEAIDLVSVYHWANLTANYTLPNNTAIIFETSTSSDGVNWSSWVETSNTHTFGNTRVMNIGSAVASYIKIRISLSSSDYIFSPKVDDFTINYYQDIAAPTNPSEIAAYSDSIKTNTLINNTWYNYSTPYFEWPAEGASGGAVDNEGGSGVAGYYVYFGIDPDADPVNYQTANNYTASGLTLNQNYYLKIQTVDNAGMVASSSYTAFIYKLDNTSPINPSTIEVNPTGYSSASLFTFTWAGDASDANSGLSKFQYRTGGDDEDVWTEIADPETVSVQVAPYTANKNTFYLRAVDNANNVSTPLTQDYYYSGGAASPPQNLTVDPAEEDNAVNNFTLTWELPESYSGDPTKLKYYYSINAWPTAYNTIETSARAAGPGPFATQYGKNTFYVVALNEGGSKSNPTDIDWGNPAQVDFYAQTTAPGPPQNVQAFDTSDRESAEYSVAIKWSVPASYDAGNFAGYVIYRSEDGINFSEIATTTGSAYVDTGLLSQLYYYYAKSKDKTNNYSIATSTVSLTPTGRYTSPPTIVSEAKLTLQSYQMTAVWSTNRVASSFVEFGTSITLGETNGQVDSVTDHSVTVTGLDAGTKYYYRVKFIDPDGNIGTSEITNFETLPPPVISDVLVSDILLDSALVSWQTNTSATCELRYGSSLITETSGGSSHIQKITGLKPTTNYSAQISCLDGDLNSFSSDEYSFTTPEQPTASDVTVQNKDNVDLPTVTVAYKTNVPTTTLIYFKSNEESSPHTYLLPEKNTEHQAEISDLDPAKEYTLSISGIDDNGIAVIPIEQKITTRSDSRPPQIITNRSIGRVIGRGNSSQANIYVKIETDEVTNIKIKYAMGVTTNLEQVTSEDPLNTYHMLTIPANPSQVYSYQIEASDAVGNMAKSEVVTVVVDNVKANATEIIAGTFSNRFGWITNLWKQ